MQKDVYFYTRLHIHAHKHFCKSFNIDTSFSQFSQRQGMGTWKKTSQAVSVLFWLVSSRLGQFKLIWKRLLLLGKYLELYSIF